MAKSVEDIQGVLQTWTEGFQAMHGRKLKKTELLNALEEMKAEKMREYIRNQFSTFKYPDLCIAAEQVIAHSYAMEDDLKGKKKRGK